MPKQTYNEKIAELKRELHAYEYMRDNNLSPYGFPGHSRKPGHGWGRLICLAPSKAAIISTCGYKVRSSEIVETGNRAEILALVEAGPLVVLWSNGFREDKIEPAVR